LHKALFIFIQFNVCVVNYLCLQQVSKTPGNVLVCPLSAHIALALVQQGAGGATRSELANVLRLDESSNDIKNSYKLLLTGLQVRLYL
jgi:serine protease inhibitor